MKIKILVKKYQREIKHMSKLVDIISMLLQNKNYK